MSGSTTSIAAPDIAPIPPTNARHNSKTVPTSRFLGDIAVTQGSPLAAFLRCPATWVAEHPESLPASLRRVVNRFGGKAGAILGQLPGGEPQRRDRPR